MTKDAFEARRRGFEEEYFRKKEAHLVDKLRKVFHQKIDKEAIRQKTGITDERVLDNLAALELSGDMMAAFQLFPLVEIAWADGQVDEHEVHAVLEALTQHGIARGSAPYAMVENALKNPVRPDARRAWLMFAEQLRKLLNPQELATFRDDLLQYARSVAEASGGLLNVAFTVSANEKRILDNIERALTPKGE